MGLFPLLQECLSLMTTPAPCLCPFISRAVGQLSAELSSGQLWPAVLERALTRPKLASHRLIGFLHLGFCPPGPWQLVFDTERRGELLEMG